MVKYKVQVSRDLVGVRTKEGIVEGTEKEDYNLSSQDYMRSLNSIEGQVEVAKQEIVRVYDSKNLSETQKDELCKKILYNNLKDISESFARALPEGSELEFFLDIPEDKK